MQPVSLVFCRLAPLIGLALCAVAVAFVHFGLSAFDWKEIHAALAAIPPDVIGVMIGLAALNYLVLGFYDLLALEYAGEKMQNRKVLLASFLGNAISNNLGQAVTDGASLRYRFYARWGMPEATIVKVALFCAASYIIGSLTLMAGGYSFSVGVESFLRGVPQGFMRAAVAAGAAALATWWAWVLFYRKEISVKGFGISPPQPLMALRQSLLAVLELSLASLVLYLPLCHEISMSYGVFIVLYVTARLAGAVSRLPGGIGVFDASFLFMTSHHYSASHVLAALVAYRLVYQGMPLALAGAGLALSELKQHPLFKTARTSGAFDDISVVIPHVFAAMLFICGALLLFSGATPDRADRLLWLHDILPLSMIEASHLIGSIIGVGLLFLSRAVQQRMDSAYYATIVLLVAGMGASLAKGWDCEQAIVLGVMLAIFITGRKHFYRKSALLALDYPPQWIFLFVLVLGLSTWLGVFSYRHVEYSSELWWQFTLNGDAPRFLRSLVAVSVVSCAVILYRLMTHRSVRMELPDASMLEKARAVASASSCTQPHLVLLGDKYLLWSDSGKSFIMYGITRKLWIAMGDPAGDPAEFEDLAWKFREQADRHGAKIAFYQVSTAYLPLYIDLGLSLVKLGEEARVPLQDFGLEGKKRQKLRQSYSKHERESGMVFEVVASADTPAIIAELRGISDRWMEGKKAREKGFSLGFFDDKYIGSCDIAVLRKEGRIVAFANLWQTTGKNELGIDLMRYSPDAPDGVMAHLTVCLMFWGKSQGYQWFTLGMSPLSGIESRPLAPLWNKIGGTIYRSGGDFYNFEGLHQYKSKFAPTWQPRYLASPSAPQVAAALLAVTSLISGGIGGAIRK